MPNTKTPGHFPTASETERNFYLSLIEPVTNRWMQNEVSQAHMVITMVSGANAGGAVAILAYIAQGSATTGIASPVLILVGYLLGFIASLLCAIGVYYASRRRVNMWAASVGEFYKGQRLWGGLWENPGHAWYGGPVLDALAWLSLVFFIGASAVGIAQMLCGGASTG